MVLIAFYKYHHLTNLRGKFIQIRWLNRFCQLKIKAPILGAFIAIQRRKRNYPLFLSTLTISILSPVK